MGSYDLMVAGAAKGQGIREGYAQGEQDGFEQGKNAGKTQGWNNALREMQTWVDKARRLEGIFAEGGLNRLWSNKMVFATVPHQLEKESLPTRRKVFLRMLAYAEYHQRHVADPVELLGGMSNRIEQAVSDAKVGKISQDDMMASMLTMSAETNKTVDSLREGQQDEIIEEWIEWRVGKLLKSAKYSSSAGIVPDAGSLGETVTTQNAGYEISQDKFDIVSDAQKYLGETRESFGY